MEDICWDVGFSIFVFGINLGLLVVLVLVGWIGLNVNFYLGFFLVVIGMFFGLL